MEIEIMNNYTYWFRNPIYSHCRLPENILIASPGNSFLWKNGSRGYFASLYPFLVISTGILKCKMYWLFNIRYGQYKRKYTKFQKHTNKILKFNTSCLYICFRLAPTCGVGCGDSSLLSVPSSSSVSSSLTRSSLYVGFTVRPVFDRVRLSMMGVSGTWTVLYLNPNSPSFSIDTLQSLTLVSTRRESGWIIIGGRWSVLGVDRRSSCWSAVQTVTWSYTGVNFSSSSAFSCGMSVWWPSPVYKITWYIITIMLVMYNTNLVMI